MDLLSAIISTRARATTTTTTTTTTTGRPAGRPAGAGADGANGVHRRRWLRPCVPGVRPGVPGVVATANVLFPINDGSASLIGKLTPTHLVDGGGVRHAITACGEYVGCLAGTTDVVRISDVCYSPSSQADVLSVGVLRRSGTIAKSGRSPGSSRRTAASCRSGRRAACSILT